MVLIDVAPVQDPHARLLETLSGLSGLARRTWFAAGAWVVGA